MRVAAAIPVAAGEIVELNAALGRIAMVAAADHDNAASSTAVTRSRSRLVSMKCPRWLTTNCFSMPFTCCQSPRMMPALRISMSMLTLHVSNGVGAGNHRVEVRELQRDGRRLAADLAARFLALIERAGRADDMSAAQGEHAHCFESNAGVAAGDHGCLAGEIQTGRDFFRCGVAGELTAWRLGVRIDGQLSGDTRERGLIDK